MIYLGVGSNLGDRVVNLRQAKDSLAPEVQVIAVSPIYETVPWGFQDQPAFLNQVLQVSTGLSPLDLLAYLKKIEVAMGRVPTVRYGPRVIDLDILLFHDQVVCLPDLVIPQPHLEERAFVLTPLADLAPALVHPVLSLTILQLLEMVDRRGIELYKR
jgi:2-amino-4-hydroxy-6-hydroxymethyldihydropteridine diphosphokinase